jgi:hypothetical protein
MVPKKQGKVNVLKVSNKVKILDLIEDDISLKKAWEK